MRLRRLAGSRLVLAGLTGLAAVVAGLVVPLVACGVDGVTPDCSDAAVCSPYIGDAPVLDSNSDTGSAETGARDDGGTSDASLDADSGGG